MGIISSIKSTINDINVIKFLRKMGKLAEISAPQTLILTNVRRIDDIKISSYAIDAAVDDNSPVWLLSDQGKILLTKAAPDVDIARTIIPPVPGEYILICDYAANRKDFRGRHFSYIREPKIISSDVFAYLFNEDTNILICTVNDSAVNSFKKIIEYRQGQASPETARTTIEISRDEHGKLYGTEFRVYVDDVNLGKVAKSKSKIFAITEGEHKLKIKTFAGGDRSKSLSFNISYGQHLKFHCGYTRIARLIPCPLPIIEGIEIIKIN